MDMSRRTFLKLSGLATAGIVAGGLNAGAPAIASTKGIPGIKEKAMLNDSSRCIGCLSCSIACKNANNLPGTFDYSPTTNGNTWSTVKFQQNSKGNPREVNLKTQCMHCSQPSCVAVCPTGAAYKREDGIVVIDQQTCIGCKYCAVACPFGAPGVSEETGTSRKCTFCEERLKEGVVPACVEACPIGALDFGDYAGLLNKAQERVERLKSDGFKNATIYGHEELGGLKVLYVLPDSPAASGLPENPKPATGDLTVKWVAGLAMAGYLVAIPLRKLFMADTDKPDNDLFKGVKKDV